MEIIHIKLQQLLRVFRILGFFTNTWPPRLDAGKKELLFRDIYYNFIIFIYAVVWIPMVISVYMNRQNIGVTMKGLSHLAGMVEAVINLVLCTINRRKLQNLLTHIEEFIRVSKDDETAILQKYVDRYAMFIIVVAILFFMAGFTVIMYPLFLPVEFPAEAWYPFSTEPLLRRATIYIMQIFTTVYTICCYSVDVLIAIFLLYSTARMEILCLELQKAVDEVHIISCIIKHQELIGFIMTTQHAFQYILFKSVFTMAFSVISGIFPLLQIETFTLIPQYISMILAALTRMYVTAWPANDLKEISMELALSAYKTAWIGKSRRIHNDLLIIIQRSQKPVLIIMGSVFPALTLEFFASFVTTVMSYFTAMRAAISV